MSNIFTTQAGKLSYVDGKDIRITQAGKLYYVGGVGNIFTTQAGKLSYITELIPPIIQSVIADSETQVTIQYRAGVPADSHNIHRSTIPGFMPGPSTIIGTNDGISTIFVDTNNLLSLTQYFYKIEAVNLAQNAFSGQSCVTTQGPCDRPGAAIGNITDTSIDVSITNDSAILEVRHQITLANDPCFLSPVIDLFDSDPTTLFFRSITGLTVDVDYLYRSQVRRSIGWCTWEFTLPFRTALVPIVPPDYIDLLVIRPKFGEVIKGSAYSVEWVSDPARTYTLRISPGTTQTYSDVATGLTGGVYLFNTNAYSDGDYTIEIEDDLGVILLQFGFWINNNSATAINHLWRDNGNWIPRFFDKNETGVGWSPHTTPGLPVSYPNSANWAVRDTSPPNETPSSAVAQLGSADRNAPSSLQDLSALIMKQLPVHDEVDIMITCLIDSDEGGQSWATYRAIEYTRFGIGALIQPFTNFAIGIWGGINIQMIWPYGTCRIDKGVGGASLEIQIRESSSVQYLASKQNVLAAARVRICNFHPVYSIRLRITRPDRINFPNRINVKLAAFGFGLPIPENYWQVETERDLVLGDLVCGCAGFAGRRGHGIAADNQGRQEYYTFGAQVITNSEPCTPACLTVPTPEFENGNGGIPPPDLGFDPPDEVEEEEVEICPPNTIKASIPSDCEPCPTNVATEESKRCVIS